MCHCGTELFNTMLLLFVVIAAALVHTASASEQNTKNCSARFQTCSSAERQRRPLCGTDNVTYASRCHLMRQQCQGSQVAIQHRGPCTVQLCLGQVYARRNRQPLLFVPTCLQDGTFAPVQCHAETGYCWCVTPAGKPIPNSSLRNARPNCRRRGKPNTRRRTSARRRKQKRVCGSDERSMFNNNLVKIFKTEYNRVATAVATDVDGHPTSQDLDRQVLDWKFSVMDKDKDNFLEKTEYRDLRRLVKKVVKPKRCAKTFTKLCDMDSDQRISREEWVSCLGLDFNLMQETVTTLTELLPNLDDDSSLERHDESEGNDCHSDRKAVLEEQKINYSEFYVPECTPDGRYQTIQCYKSTGYCWCVHEDSGKPIPGTSVKDQVPKCDAISTPLRPMSGCPDPRKQAFLKELMELMKKKMEASTDQTSTESSSVLIKETWQESTEEQIAAWNFLMLDKNKNKVLERKEWKNFRVLVSSKPQLRRCGKRLPRYCDVNNDRKISITEWLNCLSTQRTNTVPVNTTSASRRKGLNPLQVYLKEED
ncbi:SPARC-related modular calcium-binding protein 2 isoform X4 [Cryptotermes secundus]|uniref:SPARC-related modular calcium-binding protein 2 isoform X4 n=1 Tax=Cryptotermes secundus TaxID=105785 RepID=UPI000CD7B694|nr:SPARC-related modular calcium-binding protein 2 isoform X4 [Cryptotermes secundus]